VFASLDFDVSDAGENVAIGNWCCLPDGFAAGIGVLGHPIASPCVILGRVHAQKKITRLGVYNGGELAG